MLDWTDANKKIAHAKKRMQELHDAYVAWQTDRGVVWFEIKDDELAKYSWYVAMLKEPTADLSLLGGDVFGALRDALDYVAWQIYLAGGGGRDEKQANRVYFPISTKQADFNKQLKDKIPTAWPAAVDRLRAAQPFNQSNGNENALPALHSINNPSKHRELSLIAAGSFSQSATFPELPPDLGLNIALAQPGPVLKLGSFEPVARVGICRAVGNNGMETVRWSEGVALDQPPQPHTDLMFTNGNGQIGLNLIPQLVAHIEGIVRSFADLEEPEQSPA